MKLVLNRKYGVFGLSVEACLKLHCDCHAYKPYFLRTAPELIEVVEQLGSENVSAVFAHLEVVEIPDGFTDYVIDENDGKEYVYYVKNGIIHKV